jgi:type IV pilus assembly protein PilF
MNLQIKLLRGGYKQPHVDCTRKPLKIRLLILSLFLLLTAISCATTPKPEKPAEKDNATMKRDIGEASIMQGDYTTALKELLEALEISPNDPIIHNYLGIAYKNKKQPDKAIFHFKKALEIKPGYSQAKNNLGAAYLDKEDWDAAIACFKELAEDLLYTTPHFPLANLGWAYYNKKDFQQAEMYYRKAIAVQPNFIVALNGLGQTCLAMGKYAEAIDSFEKAVQFGPRFPQLHFQLAQTYELAGQMDKALLSYGRVIELAPNTDLAKDAAKAKDRIGRMK